MLFQRVPLNSINRERLDPTEYSHTVLFNPLGICVVGVN